MNLAALGTKSNLDILSKQKLQKAVRKKLPSEVKFPKQDALVKDYWFT